MSWDNITKGNITTTNHGENNSFANIQSMNPDKING